MHKIIKIVLIVISVAAFVLLFLMPDGDATMAESMASPGLNGMFILAYLLLAIAVLASVIFGIMNMISSPGGLKKAGLAVVGLFVVLGIAYGLSTSEDISISGMADKNIDITEDGVKYVGMGINMFWIMLVVAVGLIAFGAVKKAISK